MRFREIEAKTAAGIWLLAAALILWVGGATTAWPLMEHAAYLLVGLSVLAFVLVRVFARGLTIASRIGSVRVTAGEDIMERFEIGNGSRWPVPWIRLAYADGESDSLSLPADGSRTVQRRLCLNHRGSYQVGTATLTVCDPLGLFSYQPPALRGQPLAVSVTVHPRPVLTTEAAEAVRLVTDSRHRWRLDSADDMHGELRDYVPGDAPSRIHWRTTARRGELTVTDPETMSRRACWLLVDLGGDEALVETAAGVATFLAGRLWDAGLAVGAIVAGGDLHILPARRGRDRTGQILDTLALTGAARQSQLAVLQRSLTHCTHPGTLLLVSPAVGRAERTRNAASHVNPENCVEAGSPTSRELAELVSTLRATCPVVRLIHVPSTAPAASFPARSGVA